MKALMLLADGFEELTVFVPWFRLREEGVKVTLAGPAQTVLTGQHGYTLKPQARIQDLNPNDFELLLIPDGPATEKLRVREAVVDVVRTFAQEGRIAAVGHGPQLLISAGALDGRTVTCSPGIRDDVRAAGAIYRDEAVVSDGNFLTCRSLDDLSEFSRQLVKIFLAGTKV
jgi:protease I